MRGLLLQALQTDDQDALCALTWRIVSAVSFDDQVMGSNALHATVVTSGPLEPVVVVQAVSIDPASTAASILSFADDVICLNPLLV